MTLKGKFYQRSVASTGKLKGLVSLALAYQTYAHYSCIAAWTGITLPAVAGAGLLYYGLNQFHENNHLQSNPANFSLVNQVHPVQKGDELFGIELFSQYRVEKKPRF